MPIEQQIAAIKAAIAALDSAIVQTEAALLTAPAGDKPSLRAGLVDLRAKRTALQFQLDHLEAAAVVVPPLAAARSIGAARGVGRTTSGRTTASAASLRVASAAERVLTKKLNLATLKFAADVEAISKGLAIKPGDLARMRSGRTLTIGDDTTRPVRKKKRPF